jgi:hypothetical protein
MKTARKIRKEFENITDCSNRLIFFANQILHNSAGGLGIAHPIKGHCCFEETNTVLDYLDTSRNISQCKNVIWTYHIFSGRSIVVESNQTFDNFDADVFKSLGLTQRNIQQFIIWQLTGT